MTDHPTPPPRQEGDPDTTGHVWDGIEEFNNPLPKWWLWCFYITIIWGVAYTIAYPAWPLVSSATSGLLGWSSRANVVEEIAVDAAAKREIQEQLVAADLTEVVANPELMQFATRAGGAVFRTWCSQCHGAGAAGVKASGYPNLLDDDWLWGGDIESIHYTISHGIRNEDDADARYSEMPAYGDIFEAEEIDQVVNYVMTLSGGTPVDASLVDAGAVLFADNCAACHGEEGLGDPELGAPNLADAIWLYGGDYETLAETVTYSRYGVMPPWTGRLTEAQIRAVSVYVHQLGGGE